MKLIQKIVFTVLLSAFFIACEKDDSEPINSNSSVNSDVDKFTKLDVGNYWIYERHTIDRNGLETALGIYDSSFVEKDTLINGFQYAKLQMPTQLIRSGYETWFLRDSLNYLVDERGRICLSLNNFNTILYEFHETFSPTDTVFSLYRRMQYKDSLVTVPAGVFNTISMVEDIDYKGPMAGRPSNRRYFISSDQVGIIYYSTPQISSSATNTLLKLVRYSVQ